MIVFNFIPRFSNNAFAQSRSSILLNIIRYNLPDMFWFISGILFLRFIWFHNHKEQNVYILCFYLLGIIFEISQLSKNVPGTFDFLDLLFMGIGAFVESLLYNIYFKRRLV